MRNMPSDNDDGSNSSSTVRALVVLSRSWVSRLTTNDVRLPPTYVGVRRIRPSCQEVRSALTGGDAASSNAAAQAAAAVVYKVKDENGCERRMTKQEKKELKLRMKKERAEEKRRKRKADEMTKQQQQQQQQTTTDDNEIAKDDTKEPSKDTKESNGESTAETDDSAKKCHWKEKVSESNGNDDKDAANLADGVEKSNGTLSNNNGTSSSRYHELTVNRLAMDEELADLRGERVGVPPVAMSMAMGVQVSSLGGVRVEPSAGLDDALSQAWATSITESMQEAIQVRQKEDLRPMAYRLVPEVWKRLRPASLVPGVATTGHKPRENAANNNNNTKQDDDDDNKDSDELDSACLWMTIRHRVDPLDADRIVTLDVLYNQTGCHVSCGAKFGCDYLLYDGPRQERHAFAGLRIVEAANNRMPTAYDLAGYVRCLNTAGKLALLAKVVRGDGSPRVALVDLALEKILTAPTHTKRARKSARKQVGKHLAKT